MKDNDSPSAHLNPTLQYALTQLSRDTGLSFTLIHPGAIAEEDIECVFDGIDPENIQSLKLGKTVLSSESNEVLANVEQQIVSSFISVLDPAKNAWAAFFYPNGDYHVASSQGSVESFA